jgi:hypothetical protein
MRNLRYQSIIGLILFVLVSSAHAELIYGFNKVSVSKDLKTLVEFDQDDFKHFQKNANLKLRVLNGDEFVREDAILNNDNVWIWNKVLPFSKDLKFLILKEGKPISTEYFADTKSGLQFSGDKPVIEIIKGIHYLPAIPVAQNNEKRRFPIDVKALKNCKDKVLVVVFDKATNTLLWSHYGVLESFTDEIELAKDMQPMIAVVTDDSSCDK